MDVPENEGGEDGTGPVGADGDGGNEVADVDNDRGVGAFAHARIPLRGYRLAPGEEC